MNYCYLMPYRDKYIVYRPLRKLAFLANAALVNYLETRLHRPGEAADLGNPAATFLDEINFFEPDPEPPERAAPDRAFQPVMAVLFPTTACNFRCGYCYASAGDGPPARLPLELGRRAIDLVRRNALNQGLDHFILGFHGGGEPSLESGLLRELAAHARSGPLPCRINLTSNGYWSADQRAWFLDNLDEISLSLDGAQPTQDRQRPLASGAGSFFEVLKTVAALDRKAFPYGVRLTVTDESVDLLPENIHFLCRETGCRTFQAEPAFNHGRAKKNHTALKNAEKFVRAFLEAHDLARRAGRELYYSGARPWVLTERFCQAPEKALIVTPEGFLTSCYEVCGPAHILADRFFFGRMTAAGGLDLTHGRREALERSLAERRTECEACFCYWHCAGDCPSKAFSSSEMERCLMNRNITRELIVRRMIENDGLGVEPFPETSNRECRWFE
ncbi:MAG: radical SAM protein [Pseudomonadota bacterium]